MLTFQPFLQVILSRGQEFRNSFVTIVYHNLQWKFNILRQTPVGNLKDISVRVHEKANNK